MSDARNFLSRWSRRKQEARQVETEPEPISSGADETGADIQGDPIAAAPPVPPPELSDEELAALPRLDELTADTDISLFLRQGVPQALRNAALRKVWALDPKIRDFLCEAREYAYDWNVPGDVPGSGPLLATDDVKAMVARVFGGVPDAPTAAAAAAGEDAVEAAAAPLASSEADGRVTKPEGFPAHDHEDQASTAAQEPDLPSHDLTVRHRHGGAFPV